VSAFRRTSLAHGTPRHRGTEERIHEPRRRGDAEIFFLQKCTSPVGLPGRDAVGARRLKKPESERSDSSTRVRSARSVSYRISNGGACRDGCRWNCPYSRRERQRTSGVSFPDVRSRRRRTGRHTGLSLSAKPEGGLHLPTTHRGTEAQRNEFTTAERLSDSRPAKHTRKIHKLARTHLPRNVADAAVRRAGPRGPLPCHQRSAAPSS